MNRLRDLALCLWFLVAALAFFGPTLGVPALAVGLMPIYGLFLLASAAALALRLLGARGAERPGEGKRG